MPLKLTIWLTPTSDDHYTFETDLDEVVVGRDAACAVQLPFSFVSAEQFTVVAEGTSWMITDNGSTNGTVHNGRKLAPFAYSPVRSGDIIAVGDILVQVDFTQVLSESWSIEESGEEVRRMVWATLEARGATDATHLEVLSGSGRGTRLQLEKLQSATIGTAEDADLKLVDERVHGHHLELVRTGYHYELRPLNDQLTKVDGRPLSQPQRLGPEARIALGGTTLLFSDPLQRYLEEIAGEQEEHSRSAEFEALSTQQIADLTYQEEEEARDFGPPDRPPSLVETSLPHQSQSELDEIEDPNRGWGAFEITVVVVTVGLVAGGLVAMLVLFGVI